VVSSGHVLVLLGFAGLIWFWLDSMRSREIATGICAELCRRRGLQFLDETVALAKLRLRRDRDGRVRICRTYRFEFTLAGEARRSGTAVLLGIRLLDLQLDMPDGSHGIDG
jgi:hypothetical protein